METKLNTIIDWASPRYKEQRWVCNYHSQLHSGKTPVPGSVCNCARNLKDYFLIPKAYNKGKFRQWFYPKLWRWL